MDGNEAGEADGGGIYSNVAADILPLRRHKGGRHTGEHGEPIRAAYGYERGGEEHREDRERAIESGSRSRCADAARRASRARAASRIGRLVGRSVGVADSNGRRSVSRLLRGSYVNMETGSWNPVLDSTYDSNQRG